MIIAVFYTSVSRRWLAAAAALLLVVAIMPRVGVTRIAVYVPLGLVVWVAVHESGVHATIAGVALGLLTPAGPVGGRDVLERSSTASTLSALPGRPTVRAANAGVELAAACSPRGGEPLTWAVVAGLVVGKLLGIAGATLLALGRAGARCRRRGARAAAGLAALAGIGFTVSLFIAELAFDDEALVTRRRSASSRLARQRGAGRGPAGPGAAP